MSKPLEGKKILYVGHKYFGYYKNIISKLEGEFGASVDFFSIEPKSLLYRTVKFVPAFRKIYLYFFLNGITDKSKKKKYDFVLIIGSQYYHYSLLDTLKKNQKQSFFLMYQWDSIKTNKYDIYINLFDRVYSFDRNDCENDDRLIYLPLFFTDNFVTNGNSNCDIDLLFIGSADYERLAITNKISSDARKNGKVVYSYLYMPRLRYCRLKIFDRKFRSIKSDAIKFRKISIQETASLFNRSKAILDIERFNQTGLTMRTFESLGGHKKLITTNVNIKKEEFFSEKYIQVANRENIKINWNFVENDIQYFDTEKYSLKSWLNTIFNISVHEMVNN